VSHASVDITLFGLILADIIAEPMNVRQPPPPGGLHQVNSITVTTGGNVCNTGIAAVRLGMKVAASGLIGKDVLGRAVSETLSAAGLVVSDIQTTDRAQTGATIVAVEPGGERCFFHTLGASKLLDAAVFRRAFDLFKASTWVQIGYFGLLPNLTADLPTLLPELRAHAPNTKISLETVTPVDTWDRLIPILPHLDLFCPSRTEAEVLTGERSPAAMIAAFRRHLPRGLIGIKLDAEGCLLDDGKQQVLVPSYKIKVVDTTGAGDVWFAGLLTGLCKQMPLEQIGKLANRAAADCCMALGASAGVRSFNETTSRL
jgi:sugar/nucleoside kinase (ribokinase family)